MLMLLVSASAKVLTYIVVSAIVLWGYLQWKKWDYLQAARKLPCPVKAYPIIGHIPYMFQGLEVITKIAIDLFSKAAVSKGLHNVTFWCGPWPVILIHNPGDIKKVLNSSCSAEKGYEYDFGKYAFGNGLLTAPGHIWKITSRHINPLFHPHNVEQQLLPLFNINSREMVADLADRANGQPVNVVHPAIRVALKSVCQIVFGPEQDFDTKSTLFKGFMKSVKKMVFIGMKRSMKPWLRVDFIFHFLYKNELKEINKCFKDFTEQPLKIAKVNLSKKTTLNSSVPDDNSIFLKTGCTNLIDIYAELQLVHPQFTENYLKDEMLTFFIAGTDTVGLTVATCLLALGKYNDIQDRVYEEINAVVGSDDDVTKDHITRMQYLDQVYKETLRWANVVPYVLRRTTEALKLSNCTIPAGNTVAVGLIGPHMDPSTYPDPEIFDPERFSLENAPSRSQNAFLPFGSGSRMCIAKTYSNYLVKTMLIHVLRKYRVTTDMDIYNVKKCLAVTLVNTEGYYVKFKNRL